jgi:hypothetical protein
MLRRSLLITVISLLVLLGCGDELPYCEDNPDDPTCACWDAAAGAIDMGCECMRDPGAPACVIDAGDAGDSAMDAGDTGPDVDAGACGMTCPSGRMCNETTGMCVECVADADCTGASASNCGTDGVCAACEADSDCEHLTATPVCDEPTGTCGECTVDTEASRCPAPDDLACDPTALTCTGAERGSLGFCQACISDSECLTDGMGALRCVPMTFGATAMDHGTHCLRDLDDLRAVTMTPTATCPDRMRAARLGTSVGGVESTYCAIRENVTTCEAVLGYDAPCPGGDDDCGATGLDDGTCRASACTYECASPRDCASGSCSGGGPTYCD